MNEDEQARHSCWLPKIRWWRPTNSVWCCPVCFALWALRRTRYEGYGDGTIYTHEWKRVRQPWHEPS